jgi:hypothetical protein
MPYVQLSQDREDGEYTSLHNFHALWRNLEIVEEARRELSTIACENSIEPGAQAKLFQAGSAKLCRRTSLA